MHIRANPAIESVAVLTELLGAWVLDHISIWKPTCSLSELSPPSNVPEGYLTMLCTRRIRWTSVCPHILKQALSLSNELHLSR